MLKIKHIMTGSLSLILSGCGPLLENNKAFKNLPSVSYSDSILTTIDTPEIEAETPVAKAIEFIESSNPELITAQENNANLEGVTSNRHEYQKETREEISDIIEKKNKKHKVTSKDYFFPGREEIKEKKPVINKKVEKNQIIDTHSAFIFSD